MGKGKRNREAREQAPNADSLIEQLVEIEDQNQFLVFLERFPAVLGNPVLREIENRMGGATAGLFFARWHRLLLAARDDPQLAWEQNERFRAESEEAAQRLVIHLKQATEAEAAKAHQRAIGIADIAIPEAIHAELAPAVATFEAIRAFQFLARPDDDRSVNIEEAIAGFGRALGATVDPEEAARYLMHMAIAMGERPNEDPADNLDASIAALRDALGFLPPGASMDLRTTIQTNLASALLRRPRGEKASNLHEGLEVCDEVLEYRSIERDPNEWGYIKLNQAPILEQLADQGEIGHDQAQAVYEEVIDAGELIEPRHLANAHFQLARMLRSASAFDAEVFVENWEPDRPKEEGEREEAQRAELAGEARVHLEAAIELIDREQEPRQLGRVYVELAEVLHRLELPDEAIEAARSGTELMPPTTDPRESLRVGGRLGDLLARRGEWAEAAAAFRVAVEAAELAFYRALDLSARQNVAGSMINLTRWASFALAAAGEEPEAMMVLDSGRAREMRERLGLGSAASEEFSALPEALRERYEHALDEVAHARLGEDGADAARHLQEVLRDIRQLDGFQQFGTRVHPWDLLGALENDWPLLYVNPTPYGIMLLLVEENADGATVDVHFFDGSSLEILMRLLGGTAIDSPEELDSADLGSYLAGASGFSKEPRDVQKDVENVLPWIGESIAKPIHNFLEETGVRGVTLICCGPVALAPLHAAPWKGPEGRRCLIDDFEIRYAPSGAFAAASLGRARERDQDSPSLLALADPERNLPAAVPEVATIAELFEAPELAKHEEATWVYLRGHAGDAMYLHLACHAQSATWGESPPAIILADGHIFAPQLTELAELPSRLVTVSACQSAVVDITHMPEESISVGSVLLAAGAACVIASLWPVRDDTTAMLMTRLYEEMIGNDLRPPEALRRAQIWLRDLARPEADAFLKDHPELEREFRRRDAIGDAPEPDRTPSTEDGSPSHPYSDPDFWAPFIAVGA